MVKSVCPLCPTTAKSERLRKSRSNASRSRRFSISRNTRMGSWAIVSFIGVHTPRGNERRGQMIRRQRAMDGQHASRQNYANTVKLLRPLVKPPRSGNRINIKTLVAFTKVTFDRYYTYIDDMFRLQNMKSFDGRVY